MVNILNSRGSKLTRPQAQEFLSSLTLAKLEACLPGLELLEEKNGEEKNEPLSPPASLEGEAAAEFPRPMLPGAAASACVV